MQQQPAYQVEPASRTIPAHSTRRLVRFFLLCVLNALVLIGVDPFDMVRSYQPDALALFIQEQINPHTLAPWIISTGLLILGQTCLVTVMLDSFALFLPSPRLQRWTRSSYLLIGALIGLIALALVYGAISTATACLVEPTTPPCVNQVIGGRPGQRRAGGWLG
jgi:hypothetical protein